MWLGHMMQSRSNDGRLVQCPRLLQEVKVLPSPHLLTLLFGLILQRVNYLYLFILLLMFGSFIMAGGCGLVFFGNGTLHATSDKLPVLATARCLFWLHVFAGQSNHLNLAYFAL